ncbi:hypothetical protein SAMN04488543_0669 [Friedmanniella luteola]|uniref:Uncharacterized protein n=1 Tax=Friedmanniella luteola TaxID=546871 RepID=A0A1H1MM63_9ACTN|nr:hypothetical protein [Friedmanniella luteola]SDR87680.1 hypothetical protein SAMN04488543_0669 [Friedmanniella luteola]
MDDQHVPAWHEALAYAVTGVRFDDLGRQPRPDLDALTALLRPRLGAEVDVAELTRAHPLPADLAEGLGAAQLGAALAELRRRLTGPSPTVVAGERPLTADERRLLQDVPPHHGV